jgi:putative ABC transport system substrate-binding protein
MSTRRGALVAFTCLFVASQLKAQAPSTGQPKRIGVIDIGSVPEKVAPDQIPLDERPLWDLMRKKGWIVGKNLLIERVYGDWKVERLAGLAEELVRRRVDLILCDATEEAQIAAARATRTIPIVFDGAFLAQEQGLIDSYAQPGRNSTGTTMYTMSEFSAKRLEFLRAVAPDAKRLSWLWGGDSLSFEKVDGGRFDVSPVLETAAKGLGFETRFHIVRTPQDIDRTFREVMAWRAEAISAGGLPIWDARESVADLALRHRLPSAFSHREYVDAGGLMSYGASVAELESLQLRRAEYIDRILRGAKPADLAVIQPSRYELVVNMKTAKALRLTIPRSLLQRADMLIQ